MFSLSWMSGEEKETCPTHCDIPLWAVAGSGDIPVSVSLFYFLHTWPGFVFLRPLDPDSEFKTRLMTHFVCTGSLVHSLAHLLAQLAGSHECTQTYTLPYMSVNIVDLPTVTRIPFAGHVHTPREYVFPSSAQTHDTSLDDWM